MNINLLDLLNQMKKFALQEKGDLFSLLMYIFLSFVILNRYFGSPISTQYAQYTPYIAVGVVVLAFFIWLSTRRIDTKKGKINIGIAQFSILNTSVEKTLDSEQKMAFSNEIANYIYNSLNHERQSLQMEEYVNFFRLPSRIGVDYATCDKVSEELSSDILIWGTTTFAHDTFTLNYKVSFKKRINSIFFDKLINDINAYPDVAFDFSHEKNLECNKFIHMISYLSMIYKSIEWMNSNEYEKAENLIMDSMHKLNRLYMDDTDQSVNVGDKDMVKVEILMYFILAKNYFNRANHYLENFDASNEANKKLELCSNAVEQQVELIEKYLGNKKTFASHFEEMELENEYIYSLGQLGKTKNKPVIDRRLSSVSSILKDTYKFDLVQAFVETVFEDFDHAKGHYEKALQENSKNSVALRGLGMLEYEQGHLDLAQSYLQRVEDISYMHIFQPHMYDIKLQRMLAKIALKQGKPVRALRHFVRMLSFIRHNNRTLEKMYVI